LNPLIPSFKIQDLTLKFFFADNKQDLYGQGTDETLGAEVTFRLYHNCRNTERVNAATNKVCSGEVKPMPGVPNGEIPHVSICKGDFMAQKAWSLVNELSPDGGAVILSPFKLENSCMNDSRKAHGLILTEDISKHGEPGFVFYSTIKSFKGLEARHVVFVHADKPGMNPALADEDLYVAFTRATARLDIVTANQEAELWFSGLLRSLR
jgi:DNA helicase IV